MPILLCFTYGLHCQRNYNGDEDFRHIPFLPDCPHGFTGSLSLDCTSGVASVGSSSGCEPLPCPIGTTSYMEYDFVGRNVTLEAWNDA
eukprot:s2680_g3.t1